MKAIRDSAKKQSASVYLTLISIIQSFALGFLLSAVRDLSQSAPAQIWSLGSTAVITWLQIAATFQAVVLCWHVNINNAIIMERLVGLSDSYIPFFFAIPQFVLVATISPRNLGLWFYGMAGYSLMAFWAYVMMYRKDAREAENAETFRIMGWFPRFNLLYAGSAVPLFAVLGYYFRQHDVSDAVALSWLAFDNFVIVVFTVFHCHIWNRLTAV